MAGLQLTKQDFPQLTAVGDELAVSFSLKNTNLETPNTIGYFDLYLMAEDGTDWAEDGVLYCTLAADIGRVLKAGKTASFAYTLTLPAPTGDALTFFQTHRCARVALHTGTNTIYYWEVGRLLKYWAEPRITNISFVRCLADGAPDDEGTHLKSSITVSLAEDVQTDYMSLILRYAAGRVTEDSAYIDLTAHIDDALIGIDGSTTLITAPFDTAYGYNFRLTFGDAYESDVASASISNAFANLHLSGCKTGGFRFGGFSTSTEDNPKGENDYPFYAYGGLEVVGRSEPSQKALGIQCGSVDFGSVSAASAKAVSVRFPRKYADGTAPMVVIGFRYNSSSESFGSCVCGVSEKTNEGFTARCFNDSGSTRNNVHADWIAVGVTRDGVEPTVYQIDDELYIIRGVTVSQTGDKLSIS